jgi:hypothetical protein
MCGKLIVKQMMDTVAEPWREALVGTPAIPMFEVKKLYLLFARGLRTFNCYDRVR